MLEHYAGAKRRAAASEVLTYQRRGWRLQTKVDGVYCELHVGRCPCCGRSAVTVGRLRSGKIATLGEVRAARGPHRFRDTVGLHVPWSAGTVVAGELMVQTPAAARWQDEHDGIAGFVAFDVLCTGFVDEIPTGALQRAQAAGFVPRQDWAREPQSARRRELERLCAMLEGPAARAVHLVDEWATGLRNRYAEIVEAGGEGAVLVDPAAPVGVGKLKVKRQDTVTCTVLQVLPEHGVAELRLGSVGRTFYASLPKFHMGAGQLVDVRSVGFYEDWIPRHAVIERVRDDL